MTNTGRRDLARRLQQRRRQVSRRDEVEVVTYRLPHEATKEEEFSGRCRVHRQCVAVSREGRWRRTGGLDDPRLWECHRYGELETALGPWIRWSLTLLALAALRLHGGGGDGGKGKGRGRTCAIWGLWRGLTIGATALCGLGDAWLDTVDGGGGATAAIQGAAQEWVRGRSMVGLGNAGGHGIEVEERKMKTHLS